jgi:hypothetical protein
VVIFRFGRARFAENHLNTLGRRTGNSGHDFDGVGLVGFFHSLGIAEHCH